MDNQSLQQIRDLIGKTDRVAIAVGSQTSVDEMAAALSLYLSLQSMQKSVSVASAVQPTVELSSLVGINKVKGQIEGEGGDLVVSFPYREGEIEKVSYTIESGSLNIVVKAGQQGLTFQEQDVRFTRGGGGAPSVLFIIGTPRLSDLGPLFNPEALKNTTIVNIDNKSDNQGYGDIVFVQPNASSVSELVAAVLSYLGVDPDVDIAQNLLSGISYATQNFQSPNTSSVAFEMAGFLMKKGAMRAGAVRTTTAAPMRQPQYPQQPLARPQPQQQQQNEDRVSSFMPEQMKSTPGQLGRTQAQPGQQVNDQKPPSDWLTPKVYKGSSNVE